jgi:hypothetical protein
LKIGWDITRALLTEAEWTVSPPDFLNVGSGTNQDIGGPITALMIQFVQMIDKVLNPYVLLTNSFILADFLQPWRVWR